MKKNKTCAYMLAATLLVGGTFLGTKALFQDTETSNNSLILTTGKVDIEVEGGQWTRLDNTGSIVGEGTEFDNVKPGDKFVKRINISNQNSKYKVNLKVDDNTNIPEELKNIITVSNQNKDFINKGAQTSMTVEVKVEDTEEAWEKLNGTNLDLDAMYTITATQAE